MNAATYAVVLGAVLVTGACASQPTTPSTAAHQATVTFTVAVKVLGAETPIAGATVYVDGLVAGTTGADGSTLITANTPGERLLWATAAGYRQSATAAYDPTPGELDTFYMERTPVGR